MLDSPTISENVPIDVAGPMVPLVELSGLFELAQNPTRVPWQAFRPGVAIHWLYGENSVGPSAALIWFQEAGTVPMHVHEGHEHILVLAGSQTDQAGTLHAGTLRVHAPGTSHSITSAAGCIVLAVYNKPVRFL